MLRRIVRPSFLVLVAVASVAACGESATNPLGSGPGSAAINAVVINGPLNASASDSLVYFSFESNALVPRTSAWDIALRRYEVRLNGGVTGTAGVTGYSVGNNKALNDAQVLALTATTTLASFDSLRAARLPADSLFKSDRLYSNPNGFLNLQGSPTANAAAYWKVKTAAGAYTLVRVSAIVLNGPALTSVTFESRAQTGTTLGAPVSFTVAVGSTPVNVSLASNAAVIASGCNWDLLITAQSYAISTNAACNVGTYPGASTPAFAAATSASDAPQYAAYLAGLTGPVPNSTTDLQAPFRYNLAGDNKLSPSFNTYLVKNGTNVYKLQVIGYYSSAGASGFPTIRYARIK
jgi:HmuY protein